MYKGARPRTVQAQGDSAVLLANHTESWSKEGITAVVILEGDSRNVYKQFHQ